MSETSAVSVGRTEAARAVKPPSRVSKSLIIGGAIVGMFLILAVIGPYITPYPFDKFHFGTRLAPPSADFWLGTDRYGRDIFSRVVHGTSLTVFMAGTGTVIGVFCGLLIGLFSGYVGGWIDNVIMRIMDVILGFPAFLLAIAIVAVLGPGLRNALLAIAIVVLRPELHMPAVTQFIDGSGPIFGGKVFPFVFITIACGAISGFHSLIASGTTPKLLTSEPAARMIGNGPMNMPSTTTVSTMASTTILLLTGRLRTASTICCTV